MTPTQTTTHSVLASLRALTPAHRLDRLSARQVAERQAQRLIHLLDCDVSEAALSTLPRLRIVHMALPTSGLSYWNGQHWVIALDERDCLTRQRFTLLHEYKHIVDHGAADRIYRGAWEAERAADYFAACALMPRSELKRLFCAVTQDVHHLAEHFGVSLAAMRVRLEQTGLIEPTAAPRGRCSRAAGRWAAGPHPLPPIQTRSAA